MLVVSEETEEINDMKTLSEQVANEIKDELENLPEKYADTDFNSTHEGIAVIWEEFEELKDEVFFGAKRAAKEVEHDLNQAYRIEYTDSTHRRRMRTEAIQVAAMCVRFIQELT